MYGNSNMCQDKNLVYKIECTLCNQKNVYIGSTYRCLKTRINEHIKTDKKSTVYIHTLTKHNDINRIENYTFLL